MRTVISLLIALMVAAFGAVAQPVTTWEGYLADQMCGSNWKGTKGEERAKKHSRACGLEESCAASGYGIFTGGVFIKFTDASSPKAKTYLEKISAKNNIRVRVTGTLDGDKIVVSSIETAAVKSDSPPPTSKKPGSSHGGGA